MWNQCWQKYKFTTSEFHMHVNFLTCMWNSVVHVKKFCHMWELFFHAFYFMWNLFTHVKQVCHACEIWSSLVCFVSYCNVLVVRSKVHWNMRTVPCFASFLSFLLIQFVQLMNDSLRQTAGMLLVCSRCLWFNQLSVPELVQNEQRLQHVFSRNFDSLCSPAFS